ncbi:MAG: beta-galactosidase [Armatimonadota bacterium]|nr:beta-galactosidase [Armatimonadota bacterium]
MQRLYYGAAYYPELWPEEVIGEDIRHMKRVGLNVARMGEFAWAKMEPRRDEIDLSLFVDVIGRLKENGIDTVFCTPTATPPIWLSHGHPERLYVDDHGNRMSHGARQHFCTNNPAFRERSRIIVEAIAGEIGGLPGLIAWQTDNEFKCHVRECMCAECGRQWHEWLQKRYATIDRLNDAWGTQIWSELYQSFDQVPQPVATPFIHNASLSTAYRLFARDKIAEFQEEQVRIIRGHSDAPITHNCNRHFAVDPEKLFAPLDFASFDTYPSCDDWPEMVLNLDLWRNVKRERPFWVMETGASHGGNINGMPRAHGNGFLSAEAVAAYASGAEGFSYWVWRQQRTGCEITHGSILSAWGKPTVGYENVLRASEAKKQIEPIILETELCRAEVAITYSDTAKVFLTTESHGNMNYAQLIRVWYDALLRTGVYRDILPENAPLDGCKVLFTPFMPYVSPEFLAKARSFVEAGGIWIAGPFTGCRTAEHTIPTEAALGDLEKLAGVETVFTYPIGDTGAVGKAFDIAAPLGLWAAVFEPKGAEVVGRIEGGVTPGLAFLTEYSVGKGKVVMLGAMPRGDQGFEMLKAIAAHYSEMAGVEWKFSHTSGIVIIPRKRGDKTIWVAVNLSGNGGSVHVPRPAKDLLTGEPLKWFEQVVQPYGYRVIEFV